MKTEIIKILRNTDGYVSGQQLCDQLGVSRTTVWNVMNQLKEEGYELESVSKKGYRLKTCPDLITAEEVQSLVATEFIGKKVEFFEEVDSTNNVAKRLADATDADGMLVVAEVQTAGKGRRGKSFLSPRGTGIWMTLILKPDMNPVNASGLTLVAALAVAQGIKEVTGLDTYIKWPNDIVIHGKKICGILTEMSSELDYINHIVIGIGINANTEEFPEEIQSVATSIFCESGKKVKRSDLISSILKYFEMYYLIYLKNENFAELILEYKGKLINIGKQVRVLEGTKEFTGIALGINKTGELLVQTGEEVKTILSGEVSVRGVYGYV
jgi:birA, biotin-[acetyl-CoA-carboxylase] ligase region